MENIASISEENSAVIEEVSAQVAEFREWVHKLSNMAQQLSVIASGYRLE